MRFHAIVVEVVLAILLLVPLQQWHLHPLSSACWLELAAIIIAEVPTNREYELHLFSHVKRPDRDKEAPEQTAVRGSRCLCTSMMPFMYVGATCH